MVPAHIVVGIGMGARMSLKGFERCTELSLAQLRLLGALGRGRQEGRPYGDNFRVFDRLMESLVKAGFAEEYVHGGWEISENGRQHLHAAKVIAEAEAAAALGDANEERERGRDASRLDARAQRWLDIANDLRGQGSR